MKIFNLNFIWIVAATLITLSSCGDDDNPIQNGAQVTVTNTFQSESITNGVETDIESVFNQPSGALAATATVSEALEFPGYLLGLYDIDIDESTITFELVAEADDANYSQFYRTIEAGTKDRYYLTFDQDQNVKSATSDNKSVQLRLDSDRVMVVEIGEGFDFQPGAKFKINLEN